VNNRLGLIACSLFLLALTACGGGGGGDGSSAAPTPGNGNGSGSSSVTPPPSNNTMAGFAYVAHSDARAFSAFAIDATTGGLSAVPGSPFAVAPWYPGTLYITAHPSGKFVYVVNSGRGTEDPNAPPGTVSAYAINASNGALSEVAGSPFTAGDPNCLKIDPSGRFAYVTNNVSRNISAYAINAATGALSQIAGSPFSVGNSNTATMAMHPTGKFLYLANYGNPRGTVTSYAINPTTGTLTGTGSVAGAMYPLGITVDPSGTFVYLTDRGELSTIFGGVLAYRINATTGALTAVSGSPLVEGRGPQSVAVDPSGRFAYVAHPGGSNGVVSAFTINATTGAWSEVAGSPYGTEMSPRFVTIDDSGKFVYVINANPDASHAGGVFGFRIDPMTGGLTSIGELAAIDSSVTYITANRKSQ